jgi:hypothetical protein
MEQQGWSGLRDRGEWVAEVEAAAAACWDVAALLCLLTSLRLCSSCKGILALL